MSDYRDYYDEEETPSRNPATKAMLGLIAGLLVGGAAGFALGVGTNIDGGLAMEGGPRIYLVATMIIAIAVMAIAIGVKRSAMGMGQGYPQQSMAIRLIILGLVVSMLLAFGVLFMFTQ